MNLFRQVWNAQKASLQVQHIHNGKNSILNITITTMMYRKISFLQEVDFDKRQQINFTSFT